MPFRLNAPNIIPFSHAARAIKKHETITIKKRDHAQLMRIERLMKLLTRKGYLIEQQGMTYLADTDPEAALGPLHAAACAYRIAFGPRAGQKVLSLQTVPAQEPPPTPGCCVSVQGFSLHAEVRLGAHQRKKLEHLCRYITRPVIANERLTLNRAGQVVLTLKTPYRDGSWRCMQNAIVSYTGVHNERFAIHLMVRPQGTRLPDAHNPLHFLRSTWSPS